MTNRRDFIKLSGAKGQVDHEHDPSKVTYTNDQCCFKCLHYSVTESAGHVEITILNKMKYDFMVGVRTVADSAVPPKDYEEFVETLHFTKKQSEQKI
jgi:hypothetical protein